MEIYLVIIFVMLALGAGAAVMWMVNNNLSQSKAAQIIKEAEEKAEVLKKDKLLEAKEKFLQLKAEHEREVNQRNAQILKEENSNITVNFISISQMEDFYNSLLEESTQPVKSSKEDLSKELNNRLNQLIDKEKYEEAAALRDYMMLKGIKKI
jgi:ribonuclease Y